MKTSRSSSRSTKRIKLDEDGPNPKGGDDLLVKGHSHTDLEIEEDSETCCTICLQQIVNRTVIPKCAHDFCFECLLVWTEQSRRCPLCSQSMGDYLIHSIRSRYDYRKHYLAPMRTPPSPRPPSNHVYVHSTRRARRRHHQHVWGIGARDTDEESDKLERSISKRRWIYEHGLYAKHVASNVFTKYQPCPTPARFSDSQDLISRTTTFLRRELQIWANVDVEFLTTLIISLMKSIDIRSESAVKLISEFLDLVDQDEPHSSRRNAEHFVHEVYSYMRSPYKDLFVYDSVVQYDSPPGVPSLPNESRLHLNDNHPSSPRPYTATWPRGSQEMHTRRRSRSLSRSPTRANHTSPERSADRENRPGATDPNPDEGRELDFSESGLPLMERSTPLPVSITSNAEREERAVPLAASQLISAALSEDGPNLQMDSFSDTPSNPPTTELLESTTKMRPPRNKSLLESIKAHLGTTHNVELAPTSSRRGLTGISSRDQSSNTAPSMPFTPSDSNQPEILRNKDDLRLDPCQGRQNKDDSANAGTALDVVEGRARLLARLNREKRAAELCADLPGSSYSKLFGQGQSSRSGTTSPVPLLTNLEEREAKLRVQARLRARVAAEQRLAGST